MPTEQRRELLLQAAFRVMARDGVSAATTRAVCAEAQMPLASFHYVFESQQALMAELIRTTVRQEADSLQEPEISDDPVRDVEHLLLTSFAFIREHPGEDLAILELSLYAKRNNELAELALARHLAGETMVSRAIDVLAAHHGPLQTDKDELVQLAVSAAEGNTLVWQWTGDEQAAYRRIRAFAELLAHKAWGV